MDKEIEKKFDEWWATKFTKRAKGSQTQMVRIFSEEAFEQGWGEGIASMLDKADAKLSKMGRVRPREGRPTIEAAQLGISDLSDEEFCPISPNIGRILKKKGEKSGKTD